MKLTLLRFALVKMYSHYRGAFLGSVPVFRMSPMGPAGEVESFGTRAGAMAETTGWVVNGSPTAESLAGGWSLFVYTSGPR